MLYADSVSVNCQSTLARLRCRVFAITLTVFTQPNSSSTHLRTTWLTLYSGCSARAAGMFERRPEVFRAAWASTLDALQVDTNAFAS